MIRQEEVFPIGRIVKAHGTKGEVEAQLTDWPFEQSPCRYLVLEMDGILVPFFYADWREKGREDALFSFEGIDNKEAANTLVGRKIYFPLKEVVAGEDDQLNSIRSLTGFTVEGLGIITEVDDSSANILLTVQTSQGTELLVPYHDDFLESYDLRKRTLQLNLPEGLLDLN